MAEHYIRRTLETTLLRAARDFPAVILTGPRQAGKTTLLRHLFGRKYRYVSLEAPDVRMAATEDPRRFLEMYPAPVIFDEIQHTPTLLPYIKEIIDAARSKAGQYLLTGSQNLLLLERTTETLAGRAAVLKLLPLSGRERCGDPARSLPWERRRLSVAEKGEDSKRLWIELLRGGAPELAAHPHRDASLWLASYLQTYLERDVRALRQIGDLSQFQTFLHALAARNGQLLNLADLSRDLGIALNTVKAWLSILEASFQVFILRPYFANLGKRLVRTPKVYFTDTGVLCHLTGLKDPQHAAAGPMGGSIFETAVLMEIVKTFLHRGQEPSLFFWRTATGSEVDILVEREGQLIPIEVKSAATVRPEMTAGIKVLRRDLGDKIASGYLIHAGTEWLPLGGDVQAVPFTAL